MRINNSSEVKNGYFSSSFISEIVTMCWALHSLVQHEQNKLNWFTGHQDLFLLLLKH